LKKDWPLLADKANKLFKEDIYLDMTVNHVPGIPISKTDPLYQILLTKKQELLKSV